ncbi:TonB-dependent receptor [Chryseobacterium carnipullorum]|uniref:Enterobactin outer-membrane receptor n=1 Tax=Chryseobacterium carnipullorum TaxID=1124835 RepID=A0A376DP70_CHRCU|nr:TonB-dependent receptor [Chryseobacterium carnipullorum]AZA48633.1 TonB-dependent receptor [Chryseobacterium carnipullorum]AZA63551.1 TonB-dependent receptor [Chryseobacterium carnipullorum]STC92794.1 Enterobactin outer-membrane receptor [Chryseobacterium carnipullorum]
MKKRSIFLMAATATLYFNNAYAQETPQDSVKTSSIDQIVITGNSGPKKKIESSTAISTFSAKEIQKQNPISAAALLQRVPGFAVETSGGEVGNNLFARGIPSAGAYEFVQVQEDGLPVFEDGALQFANADNFFRVDNSVSRLEALRGGSGSIYANNSPGGLINFITKEGSNDFKGTAKLETSTYGLMRTDMNLGGALVKDKLFFNVGGFYRTDNGIRKTGFRANNGGQIRMNLKYVFDKGYAKVYYKKLDDRNTFYLPIPLLQDGNDLKEFPGFNANYGTYSYRGVSQLNIPQAGGGFFKRDLENGIHPKVDVLGAEFKYDLGNNFSVLNKTRYTNINMEYTGMFPAGAPKLASDYATKPVSEGGLGMSNYQYSLVSNGSVVNPQYIQKLGFWAIDKQMNNFVNDLQLNYKFDKGSVTAGFYKSNWKSHQYWNWSNVLATASDRPTLLNLVNPSISPSGAGYSQTYNGVKDMSFLIRDSQIQGSLNDVYLNLDYNVTDALSLNGGMRYSRDYYKGYGVNTTTANLNNSGLTTDGTHSFVTTTADDNMAVLGNKYTYWNYDINKVSYTLAANYKLNKGNAVYARFSHGFRSPNEEAYYNNMSDLSAIKAVDTNQLEVGYKYYSRTFDIGIIPFYSTLKNLSFTDVFSDGTSENKFANTTNFGVEIEGYTRLFNNILEVTFNGTIQNPKYKDFVGKNADGTTFDYDGNTVRRMPKFYFNISPAVNITKEWRAYVSMNYYGKRFQNEGNTDDNILPSFTEVGAGMSYQLGKIRFAVDGTNIFNTIGITEGDPRSQITPGTNIRMARPIMGAAARASITLDF